VSYHLAEKLKSVSITLPKAMMIYAILGYSLGFVMLLTFIFVLGDDIDGILGTATGQPWIQVIWNATGSRAATIVMVTIIAFFFIFGAVSCNTTSSRQLYAFARDGGLPYSKWICKVRSKLNKGHLELIKTNLSDTACSNPLRFANAFH
jgi:choline transport protein